MHRRSLLIGGGLLAAGSATTALAQIPRRTPGQIVGPFYPVLKPSETDGDLTLVSGRKERASGQLIRISGRVINEAGNPVPNAQIEVWQADARGRYAHQSDRSSQQADPNFQGYADLRSDADGRYAFVTVTPGAYPDDGASGMRAPHIHFQVTGRVNRLATQMYFAGEELNNTDRVLAFAEISREQLIVPLDPPKRSETIMTGV